MQTQSLFFRQRGRRLEEFVDDVRMGADGETADQDADVVLGRPRVDWGFDSLNFFDFRTIDDDASVGAPGAGLNASDAAAQRITLDPRRGFGVESKDDRGVARQSVDGDEVLAMSVAGEGEAISATIRLRDVISDVGVDAAGANAKGRASGGVVTITAYKDGEVVAEKTIAVDKRNAFIDFDAGVAFDELRFSAGDEKTMFKLRDIGVDVRIQNDAPAPAPEAVEEPAPIAADFTGAGQVVVVIDTGWSDVYLNADETPIFDYDFNAEGGEDDDAQSSNYHGARVTQVVYNAATGVDTINLKVFDEYGRANTADAEKALRWVVDHAADYDIVAVNLSFGGAVTRTAATSTRLSDEFAELDALGILSIAAAGNGDATGVKDPAADPNVIAVSGVKHDTNEISEVSQHDPVLTDIFAFGERVPLETELGGLRLVSGTSYAAPYVSGTAARVQEAATELLGRKLTSDEFVDLLQKSGEAVAGYDHADAPDGYRVADGDAAVQYLIDHADDYFVFA